MKMLAPLRFFFSSFLGKTMPAIKLDALVVGAGFAGMYQLLCLRDKLKLDVAVIERGSEV